MMGTMVECAHWTSDLQAAGWCHLWWATPQKSSRQGVVGAGLTPHRWQTLLPLPDIPPLGLQFSHTPNFAPNLSIFISHLLSNFTISHHPISIIICHGKMPSLLGYK